VSLYYPFTLAGSLLLVSGAALLAVGFTRSNVYALLLAVFALLILALLAALGRIQAIRFQRVQVRWDSSQTLIAHRRGLSERVLVERVRTFLFFRLHVRIRGKLQVGRDAHLGISREIATIGGGAADIPLDLPLSGLLASRGSTAVRDVFGLSRSRFGEVYQITRPVLPESVRELERLPISATGGNEEQNRKAQVDEEKYFMREYIPGDRARDINWKASSRLNQLITRISPYTQERSKVIRIELRPYRRPRQESLDSVMHLNRLKARLVSFLRAVKHEHPEYTFEIHCGETRWMVQAEEQIEALARDLAGLFYRPDAGSHPAPAGGQLVIFSTPFDEGLRAALPSYPKTVLHVITTTEPDPRRREEAEREPLYRSIFQRGRIDLPVPGRWALRRERARSSLGKALPAEAGITGTVTEEPIAVTLFEES
jgi:uncharacterized protein (DUF58 family)